MIHRPDGRTPSRSWRTDERVAVVSATRRRRPFPWQAITPVIGVALVTVYAAWSNSMPELPGPPPGALAEAANRVPVEENSAPIYAKAAAAVILPEGQTDDSLKEAMRGPAIPSGVVAGAIANNMGPIGQLRVARRLPGFQSIPADITMETVLPRYADWTPLVRLATMDARRQLATNPDMAAFSRLDDVLQLGRRMLYSPGEFRVARYLGGAYVSLALDAMTRERGALSRASDATLAAWAAELDELDHLESPTDALWVGDRDAMVRTLRDAPEAAFDDLRRVTNGRFPFAFPGLEKWLVSAAAEPFANDMNTRMIAASKRALGPGFKTEADLWWEEARAGTRVSLGAAALFHPRATVAMLVIDVWRIDLASETTGVLASEARFDGWRVGLAMERFKRANGRPPTRLGELVPRYLRAMPADPFMPLQPLKFDGQRVWTVHWDGRNDGGRMNGDASAFADPKRKPGDLVVWPPPPPGLR